MEDWLFLGQEFFSMYDWEIRGTSKTGVVEFTHLCPNDMYPLYLVALEMNAFRMNHEGEFRLAEEEINRFRRLIDEGLMSLAAISKISGIDEGLLWDMYEGKTNRGTPPEGGGVLMLLHKKFFPEEWDCALATRKPEEMNGIIISGDKGEEDLGESSSSEMIAFERCEGAEN